MFPIFDRPTFIQQSRLFDILNDRIVNNSN